MDALHLKQEPCCCSRNADLSRRGHVRSGNLSIHRQLHTTTLVQGRHSRLTQRKNDSSRVARMRHVQVRHCLGNPESQQSRQGSATREIGRAEQSVAACLWPLVLECGPALADVEAKYNPTQGSESVKTVAGVFYAGLLAIFAFRLLSRRAKKFRDERIASSPAEEPAAGGAALTEQDEPAVTPLRALWSALRLGAFACLLYLLSTNVDNYFEGQVLPNQLTARNITITVRTIVRGLSYLLTFLFAANTVGLTALTLQLLINPEAGSQPTDVKATEAVDDLTSGGSSSNRP